MFRKNNLLNNQVVHVQFCSGECHNLHSCIVSILQYLAFIFALFALIFSLKDLVNKETYDEYEAKTTLELDRLKSQQHSLQQEIDSIESSILQEVDEKRIGN